MKHDWKHHKIAEVLLRQIGFDTIEATREEDIQSIADRWIMDSGIKVLPIGLKARGPNSRFDYNLTAWSYATGPLPEFANAGGKLYLYQMKDRRNLLVRMPSQKILNTLLPRAWKYPMGGGWVEGREGVAFVRPDSEGSDVEQGVIFVLKRHVEILVEWDAEANITWEHPEFLFAEV